MGKMTQQFREAGEKAGGKMNIATAIEIVENFNKWRIGESENIAKPSQITDAINLVLEACKQIESKKTYDFKSSLIENKIDLNKNRFQ